MHGDGGKILEMFCKSFDVRMLQIKTCPDKTCRVEKESFTFGKKVTNELAIDFRTFCVCRKQHKFFNVKFWLIFE